MKTLLALLLLSHAMPTNAADLTDAQVISVAVGGLLTVIVLQFVLCCARGGK